MDERRLEVKQSTRTTSPWTVRERIGMLVWRAVWLLLFRPSPKPLKVWRLALLRLFGARISGRPFVASSAKVRIPWLLTIEPNACLGEGAEVYNLGPVRLGPRCVVAQHVYLCAGTHDLADPDLPLMTGPIDVGADAFVGAKALVLPGVVIAEGAVVGAGSVVTKDLPAWTISAGNPCRAIKPRDWSGKRPGTPHG
jgi:putative colanic acid biosynthesis acetyltransferase WcaF